MDISYNYIIAHYLQFYRVQILAVVFSCILVYILKLQKNIVDMSDRLNQHTTRLQKSRRLRRKLQIKNEQLETIIDKLCLRFDSNPTDFTLNKIKEIITTPEDLDYNLASLTNLKRRAKELGMVHLSHYKWTARKALAQSIQAHDQIHRIYVALGMDPPVNQVSSDDDST